MTKKDELVCPKIESMINTLIDCREDCLKFDTKERGWKPAGSRLRRALMDTAKACSEVRKQIQSIKNGAE